MLILQIDTAEDAPTGVFPVHKATVNEFKHSAGCQTQLRKSCKQYGTAMSSHSLRAHHCALGSVSQAASHVRCLDSLEQESDVQFQHDKPSCVIVRVLLTLLFAYTALIVMQTNTQHPTRTH